MNRVVLRLLPWLLAIGGAGLVVLLHLRHEALADSYRTLQLQSITAYRGLTLPAFDGTPTEGDSSISVAAMPEGHRQVLLMVRADCPYCKATIPTWRKLVSAIDSAALTPAALTADAPHPRVLALSLDSLPDSTVALFAEHGLAVPVLSFPSARLRRLYHGSTVPQTLVVDSEGRVLFARAGLLRSPEVLDSILQAATTPRPTALSPTSFSAR